MKFQIYGNIKHEMFQTTNQLGILLYCKLEQNAAGLYGR